MLTKRHAACQLTPDSLLTSCTLTLPQRPCGVHLLPTACSTLHHTLTRALTLRPLHHLRGVHLTSLTPRPTLATRSGMSNMYGGMNGGMGGMMGMVRGTSQYQPRMNFGMSYR